jgi:hypothetical protein
MRSGGRMPLILGDRKRSHNKSSAATLLLPTLLSRPDQFHLLPAPWSARQMDENAEREMHFGDRHVGLRTAAQRDATEAREL